jgi:hypothetical protein
VANEIQVIVIDPNELDRYARAIARIADKDQLPQFAATRGGMTTRAGFVTRFRSATISMSVAAIGRLRRFCPGGAHEFLSLRLLRRSSSRLHLCRWSDGR